MGMFFIYIILILNLKDMTHSGRICRSQIRCIQSNTDASNASFWRVKCSPYGIFNQVIDLYIPVLVPCYQFSFVRVQNYAIHSLFILVYPLKAWRPQIVNSYRSILTASINPIAILLKTDWCNIVCEVCILPILNYFKLFFNDLFLLLFYCLSILCQSLTASEIINHHSISTCSS